MRPFTSSFTLDRPHSPSSSAIVIVAGYTDLMANFIHANPGLESRFNKYFYFEDYDGEQLTEKGLVHGLLGLEGGLSHKARHQPGPVHLLRPRGGAGR